MRRALRLAFPLLSGLWLSACSQPDEGVLDFLVATEPVEYDGVAVHPERVAQLRADIERYRAEVSQTLDRMMRVATFQKMLANELMQQELYGPALDALTSAIAIQTDNPVLYYLAAVAGALLLSLAAMGILGARSAKAQPTPAAGAALLRQAERHYRIALEIRPEYQEALFGLAVLLAFELDRPEDALEYAQRLAQLETGDVAVRFLHANVLVRAGELERAVDVYDRIASQETGEQRRQAQDNRDRLLEALR